MILKGWVDKPCEQLNILNLVPQNTHDHVALRTGRARHASARRSETSRGRGALHDLAGCAVAVGLVDGGVALAIFCVVLAANSAAGATGKPNSKAERCVGGVDLRRNKNMNIRSGKILAPRASQESRRNLKVHLTRGVSMVDSCSL